MALTLRTLALAASLCTALPLTVQASVLMLNFEDLSLVAGTSLDLVSNQPYDLKKLTFSIPASHAGGGTVSADKWDIDYAGAAGIPQPKLGDNFAGGVNFDLKINSSACTAAGSELGCFNRLSMYALAAGGSITIFDILGNSMALPLAGSSGGSSDWNLIGSPVAIPTTALISRIEFRSTVGIYFDDLSLSYDSTTPGGGSLPEPAGLGLVALALAGLGLTRRLVGRSAQR